MHNLPRKTHRVKSEISLLMAFLAKKERHHPYPFQSFTYLGCLKTLLWFGEEHVRNQSPFTPVNGIQSIVTAIRKLFSILFCYRISF